MVLEKSANNSENDKERLMEHANIKNQIVFVEIKNKRPVILSDKQEYEQAWTIFSLNF